MNNAPAINNLDSSPPLEISLGNNIAESLDAGNTAEATVFIDDAVSTEFEGQLNTEFNNNFETVEQIQNTLGQIAEETGKKPGIIYVMARPEQLDLVLVTPDQGQIIYRTVYEAERKIVLQKANDLRAEITNQRKRNSNSYLALAQQMYKWMISPLAQDLQDAQIDTIAFVLDSGLRTLPIAVLHDGEGFIIEKFSVGLIPSINLVDTKYRSLKDASILAMGASQFKELSPLPAVPTEIATITEAWQGKSFLNKDFTLANLRNSRAEYPYRIIHLATHGEFQPGDLTNSYIQLWDEKLSITELQNLNFADPPVDLLVLSACRTAVGDDNVELGFAGLAVQAGVKSALASLWYVSDEGTLALMTEFYKRLQDTTTKSEALRLAQLDMIRGNVKIENGSIRGSYARGGNDRGALIPLPDELGNIDNRVLSHPYYWAAFTMIGSPW